MKIGILSDTHNNAANTRTALDAFRDEGITRLIHCGDITTPEIVYLFAGWDVTFVLGNMDLNREELVSATENIGALPPQFRREVQLGQTLIGITHGAQGDVLQSMMMSGKYRYVCYGHTHERSDEFRTPYNVRIINPGALGGGFPQTRSVCILDVETDELRFIEFPSMR